MKPVPCKTCNKLIGWVEMAGSHKRAPLDIAPDADKGNIAVHANIGRVLKGEELERARAAKLPLYLSHFASCKDAAVHRKAKAAK